MKLIVSGEARLNTAHQRHAFLNSSENFPWQVMFWITVSNPSRKGDKAGQQDTQSRYGKWELLKSSVNVTQHENTTYAANILKCMKI